MTTATRELNKGISPPVGPAWPSALDLGLSIRLVCERTQDSARTGLAT